MADKKTEIYKKTHTSKAALDEHIKKIVARDGAYRVKGLTIEYGFPEPSKDDSIKSREYVDLILEAANKGYKRVKVVFYPPWDEKKYGNIKNKKLIALMKKSKVSIFDVVKETKDIIELLNDKENVKEIKFTTEKEKS